jgi:hypothetical protein
MVIMARTDIQQRRILDNAHIFERSVRLLQAHFDAQAPTQAPDRANRDTLAEKMLFNATMGFGLIQEYQHYAGVGASGAAGDSLTQAESRLTWALIYASAARKANRDEHGQIMNRRLEDKISASREKILGLSAALPLLGDLQAALDTAEGRGWQRGDGDTRLPICIGATWCLDTAKTVDITSAFRIPVHLLIMDEDNRDVEQGYTLFNDHALSIITDPYSEQLHIPVIIFPDSTQVVEPKPVTVVSALVEHRLM